MVRAEFERVYYSLNGIAEDPREVVLFHLAIHEEDV
jgi:hypothetical protein